ncbi:hypothetical protein YC2023_066287 [Brassica napus]
MGVRQHTQDIRGCTCVSVRVRLCPSADTGRPWLSISTHISTLVLGLSTLALPVDCLGDFGPRGQSVQYTQDVRGCPPAHTGRLWLSVRTHRTSVAVCECPCVYVCVCQDTQDVCGCPLAHTGRPCVSVRTHRTCVAVRVCPSVSVSTHRTSVAVHHTHMTSVGVRQHTQDVRGCPWLSVSTHRMSVDVRVCPCVSVSTHRMSVCPSAHTGRPWLSMCVHVCPSEHTGHPWLSISTHISTLVLGLSTLTLPVDSLVYFGPRGLFVQYTQDVRGCPPAHTGHLWLSVSTHRTYVAVCGCPCVSVSTHRTSAVCSVHTGHPWVFVSAHKTSVCVRQHTQDVHGCPCMTVCVRQHTQDLRGCSGDFGPCGLVVQYTQDVRGCPLAHTGCMWLSVSTHRTSVAVYVCPCVSVSTHRTSVAVHHLFSTHMAFVGVRQHTQDVCGNPSAHTRRLWLSVCVRVCLSVSISTHRTSVAVHQYTYQHVGPWTQHAGPSRGLFG